MSTLSVTKKIKAAQKDAFITTREAKAIVTEAEKGYVSKGEGDAIADLFSRGNRVVPPGMFVTMAIPENPGDVQMDSGATEALEGFFTKHNLAAGSNKEILKDRAVLSLETQTAELLSEAPRGFRKMQQIDITPEGLMDISRTAFIDAKKGQVYLRVMGFMGPGGPMRPMQNWSGPVKLLEQPTAITLAIPENPSDGGFVTLAIPENPGDTGLAGN